MKKILTAGVALLSVATLAACSGKTASNSSSKDAKASSSKVEKSSTSTSKSKSSSKSSKTSVDIPEIVLLTDEEIDNAKTIGDMKSLYNYKKYAQDLGGKIPESDRSAQTNQVYPALKTLDESKSQFDKVLSAAGSDDTVVPEQGRAQFAQQLKTARNTMKQAMESAYKMASPYISSSSDDE